MGSACVSDMEGGSQASWVFFSPRTHSLCTLVTHGDSNSADSCLSSTQMLRLRQWEAQLLREIEEAVHHELTIQEGVLSTELPDQAQGLLSISTVRVDPQDPGALA